MQSNKAGSSRRAVAVEPLEGRREGRKEGWRDGWMDGWMDGWRMRRNKREREGRKRNKRGETKLKRKMSDNHCVSVALVTRRNWKNRYFALRGKTLLYYSESDLATAKPNGAIDLKDVTYVQLPILVPVFPSFLSHVCSCTCIINSHMQWYH